MLNGFDPEVYIRKYIDIRNYVKRETEAFNERMKTYKEAMATIENALALFAQEHNLSAVKTAVGTAFPVAQLRVSCEDRQVFHEFVITNHATEFLTAHVVKDAVKNYMEQHAGQLPPGVQIERFIEWQVRQS